MSGPKLAQLDPVTEGEEFEAHFEGLTPGQNYRVHILHPSGESEYLQGKAAKDGTLRVRVTASSAAQHVVEVQSADKDHHVLASGHMVGYAREAE